jgi:DNA repair protein SbcC/Rad50
MKILQVRFRNLNSLTGEWAIDFTHPAYAVNGIFAITGPTGSGKTSLLDAICLALYGRTPRLDRITESSNEIMSRHTGLCFSEVLFATKKGLFRCHWSQRRARQQSSGKLQQPRHEIADNRTGQVLESRIKDVARKVEEVTGMDFDQFTRSVLLAQGGFAAFLQASSDERAPILEQITGTGIYSRISQTVHQLKNIEQQKLAMLESEVAAMTLLSKEEEEATRMDLAGLQKNSAEIFEHLRTAQTGLAWLTNLNSLQGEIAFLTAETEEIDRRLRDTEPDRLRLERAQEVRLLEGNYRHILQLRTLQEKERAEAVKVEQDIDAADRRAAGTLAQQGQAKALADSAQEAHLREIALCREIRELDLKLQEAASRLESVVKENEAAEKERQIHDTLFEETRKAISDKTSLLQDVQEYLQQHAHDAGLMEEYAGLQELAKNTSQLTEKSETLQRELIVAQTACRNAVALAAKAAAIFEKNLAAQTGAAALHERSRQEITNLLAGRNPSGLREDLQRLTERFHLLDKAHQLARQIANLESELAALGDEQRQAMASLEENGRNQSALTEKLILQRQLVAKQEEILLLATRVRSFEDERAHLRDGSPCPLCGATEHPFVTSSVIRPGEAEQALLQAKEILQGLQTEDARLQAHIAIAREKQKQAHIDEEKTRLRIDEAKAELARTTDGLLPPPGNLEVELVRIENERLRLHQFLRDMDAKVHLSDTARDAADQARKLCDQSRLQMEQAGHAEALAVENCKRTEADAGTIAEELQRGLDHIAQRVAPYGITGLAPGSWNRIIAGLGLRQQKWRQHKDREQALQTDLQTLHIALEREKSLVQKQVAELDRLGQQIRMNQDKVEEFRKNRHERFGEKDPDEEEKRAEANSTQAQKHLATISEELHLLEKNRAVLDERKTTLTQSINDRAATLVREEQSFLRTITGKGFADETAFNAARLTEEDMAERAGILEELKRKEVEIKTLLQSKKESRVLEEQKQLTALSYDDLTRQIEEKTEALHALQQQIGMLEGRLKADDEQRTKHSTRREALEKQRLELKRWQQLHELIGSSDGKKFRNFAQGITFEIMVGHANRNLQRMTGRYILIRDALQPLELNVIDTYQAGEIRSTKNLSGGESFIISLALALGLAGMASKNVQVDSLFLDEGFGTLDEDSLETALETLAGLQQDGKIIGIISHVQALQERITTRIQVIPGPAGRSGLEGPGVSRT